MSALSLGGDILSPEEEESAGSLASVLAKEQVKDNDVYAALMQGNWVSSELTIDNVGKLAQHELYHLSLW